MSDDETCGTLGLETNFCTAADLRIPVRSKGFIRTRSGFSPEIQTIYKDGAGEKQMGGSPAREHGRRTHERKYAGERSGRK